ncbi:2-amino-4-hydroxy-6-hydroxymethyldihydropteridine diphosphokinase [Candidatus Desantisbacteria bacterium CG_4_10_14_0_8_um_filter_48_22]|uniref:2-amino-4-hydroxy-6-hydroxymethyldihydropteridine diphosphokinase n=1 Tax=Candidatus Desantisbacteria bacterium CG_4_10_14_0_8_um_filter_48_22 TaxID=1974543 RepID=A0A2M7S9Y6_9BACT|nr:MAG: 2-amino-4-hydroxy-6-hydroxymethyldihydropteridine diphosphokinase [Candidatus Desantisbacteria bacterium CG1_02_49_89]PIV54230.1 MAG: 2-amino-4-hydroxy-6-hydroxymethyldihydropteridine diphosphokinase [Candidatus Desantisbacteria bacterium CG02_land_8_20_14_3_00_49_13]PIZ16347.1 MAG: 2-amino-4-hydroxy-6-hydroxymethyldihydropteridine diphosphokinase [Candidatus Desantisbacteria bacterium CG_4_10_14_0_8_um_filter_48_22]PJB27428.1 MAG: 2-amino-4-hydroxy-6-hydroxymethyldihydropteridine diphos
MKTVYLAIGSNLGNRRQNVLGAAAVMQKTKGINIKKMSKLYETEPWGYKDQPKFINAAVLAETVLAPTQLFLILKGIEKKLGRKPQKIKWGPRKIDIDILLYGDKAVETNRLRIPHPEMHRRLFVLKPLAEIAPGVTHPVLKKTIKELLKKLEPRINTGQHRCNSRL